MEMRMEMRLRDDERGLGGMCFFLCDEQSIKHGLRGGEERRGKNETYSPHMSLRQWDSTTKTMYMRENEREQQRRRENQNAMPQTPKKTML